MQSTVCYMPSSAFTVEFKKRKRMHGTEYYGKVFQESPWSFSYIQARDGKEAFFYPFETSKPVKEAIIRCVTKTESS